MLKVDTAGELSDAEAGDQRRADLVAELRPFTISAQLKSLSSNLRVAGRILPKMATSVDSKLLKATKFPPEFNQKVDMQKVNVEVMKK